MAKKDEEKKRSLTRGEPNIHGGVSDRSLGARRMFASNNQKRAELAKRTAKYITEDIPGSVANVGAKRKEFKANIADKYSPSYAGATRRNIVEKTKKSTTIPANYENETLKGFGDTTRANDLSFTKKIDNQTPSVGAKLKTPYGKLSRTKNDKKEGAIFSEIKLSKSETGRQPIIRENLNNGDQKFSLNQADGGSGSIIVNRGAIRNKNQSPIATAAESTFRNAVQGDNSGTRAQQKQQFDARQYPGPPRTFGAVRRNTESTPRMPQFTAPGFTGDARAIRINSQQQRWLRDQADKKQQMDIAKLNSETSLQNAATRNATSKENSLAADRRAERRITADKENAALIEGGRNERAGAKTLNKPAVTEAAQLKFKANAAEAYAKYRADPLVGDNPMSEAEFLRKTYPDDVLSGYGYDIKEIDAVNDLFAGKL